MIPFFRLGLCSIAAATAFSATTLAPTPANAWCFWVYCSPTPRKSRSGAGKANFQDLARAPDTPPENEGCGPYGCYGLSKVNMTLKIKDANGRNKTLRTKLPTSDIEAIAQQKPRNRPAKTAEILVKRMQAKDDRVPDDLQKTLARQFQGLPTDTPNDKARLASVYKEGTTVAVSFEFAVDLGQGDISKLGTRKQRKGDGGSNTGGGDRVN